MTASEKRAKDEFRVFLFLMWQILSLPNPTRAQYAFADYLQYGPSRKVVMAFRGVGKSWVTAAYVLWCLWRDPQEKILVISASAQRARDFSVFCKKVIDEWEMLVELRPRPGQRESVENFDVGPARAAQAPSVKSVGITGQITGTRAHRIIYDDVEVPKNSETVTMREKLSEAIKEAAAVLVPDSSDTSVIYLGTPQTEDTVYVKLPERGYEIRIWPARYPDEKVLTAYRSLGADIFPELAEDMAGEGAILVDKPTDPARFDEEELLTRRKEYGASGWQLQFMLNPSLSDSERYPLKLRDLVVGSFDPELVPNKVVWSGDRDHIAEDLRSVGLSGDKFQRRLVLKSEDGGEMGGYAPLEGGLLCIDPSGRGADETAYCVTKHLNGQIFLMESGGFRGDGYSEETITKLAKKYDRWGCKAVRIESNFGDGMYTKLASPVFKKVAGRGLDPDEVEWRATTSKEGRIIDTLEPVMSAHKLIVDEEVVRKDYDMASADDPHRMHRMLFHQMTRVTRARGALRFDDRLDCLAMAVNYWIERLGKDVDVEVKRRQEDALDRELEKFVKGFGEGDGAGRGVLGRWYKRAG
jgi:hypothetical protein